MRLNVRGQIPQPFSLPCVGVPADESAIAPRRIVAWPELEIFVISDCGVPVICATLGGARESQQNLRTLWGQLFGFGQKINRLGGIPQCGATCPSSTSESTLSG